MSTFDLTGLIVPGVGPLFQMVHEAFGSVLSEVVDDDRVLGSVSVPPLVGELDVGVRVFSASFPGLTSARFTPVPEACLLIRSDRDDGIVFLDSFKLVVAADSYVGRDSVEVPLLGIVPVGFPVFLRGSVDGLSSKLIRSLEAGLFFEAVAGGTIVSLNGLEVGGAIMSL